MLWSIAERSMSMALVSCMASCPSVVTRCHPVSTPCHTVRDALGRDAAMSLRQKQQHQHDVADDAHRQEGDERQHQLVREGPIAVAADDLDRFLRRCLHRQHQCDAG